MNTDRRTIFALVATGRITAAEAERLLASLSDAQEMFCIVALCALVCLASLHSGGALKATLTAAAHTLHNVIRFALHTIGGRP